MHLHQITFGGRALPRPGAGVYSAPPDTLSGLGKPTFKGRRWEREWKKRNERECRERGEKRRESEGRLPPFYGS